MFCWCHFETRNWKSAHLVATASRERLKECNQTQPRFFWRLTFQESVRNQLPICESGPKIVRLMTKL